MTWPRPLRMAVNLVRPVWDDGVVDVAPPRPPGPLGIVGWVAVMVLATLGMLVVRARLNEAHVALVYLLVVLGSSAYAGRAFGLAVAGVAFVLFDWFFLPPYGTLNVVNPLDWLVLFAFLGTSAVAAQLLYRASTQAQAANARAIEIDRLAVLGAETLNAGRALDALPAIATVIRTTLELGWCEVYLRESEGDTIQRAARSLGDRDANVDLVTSEGNLVQWVAKHGSEAAEFDDGTSRVAAAIAAVGVGDGRTSGGGDSREWLVLTDPRQRPLLVALYLPLHVRDRVVGVLGIGSATGFVLGRSRRRVLRALSYYAALGVERVRLTRDAENAEALRVADRLKDALLASVSHDLRTPLTTIKALANEMAVAGDERAVTIEEEADRLNGFVENLLDLSRIHAGGVTRPPIPNDAEDLVGAALQRISGRSAGRQVRTVVEAAGDALLIGRFDFTDTLHALVNLLENAIKYSPASTVIDLTVRRDGPWLSFAVADRGPGVPPSERARIFEPFYRPRRSLPDAGGAGLGLSIARSLAAAQGGSVVVDPREGGGSVFTLRVPALDPSTLAVPPTDE